MMHRILVIDDNPAIHNDIRKILARPESGGSSLEDAETLLFGEKAEEEQQISFDIDSAFQGQEGLELVKRSLEAKNAYALAFVDVRMPPGWDGIETISRIWEVYPELQVVICTAYSDYSWEDITRKVGRSDSVLILKKPFDNIEVLQMAHALTKKWFLTQESKSQLLNLDKMVSVRTEELQVANKRLTEEIAERSQAENQLRLSEERFAKAFKSSPIPMSLQSLKDYRYLDVNDSYLDMTGYSRAEILGASSIDVHVWADNEVRGQVFDQLRAGKSVRNVETRIRRKDREERTSLLSAEQICLGAETFALISEHDISQRLQLESQLRQAQKMEAIGHLAAGVAHDFRNILTVIQGHANLRLLAPDIDPKLAESLNQITEAVERASNLTRQLLAFSRKQIMQLEVININRLVEHLTSMLSRLIGEQVSLKCDFFDDLPLIEADVCSVEQVIMNLAVNARDAMPLGGHLLIGTSVVEIDSSYAASHAEASEGKYICITVNDTGCGMDETTKGRLFEPFFTTKEVGKGTGMGLATAYGIIKQHNGWIEVESKVGRGSTFRVFLPASSRTDEKQEKPQNLPQALGGRETILVVEDEEPVRRFVCDLLREYGYNVRVASNGVEALNVWKQSGDEIDLLLTDVVMPQQISGLELAQRMTQDKSGLKVIYTSGYSLELLDRHFGSRSDVNFLPKPYHPLKLAEAVRTCLDS
ncbi:MAG TPA: response regulator [Verrucomicrobiae bacterium]|nr:response regulator [Verrucomicrobiae bacterium]